MSRQNNKSDASAAQEKRTERIDYKKLMEEVLLRKAKGYSFEEKTEEFAVMDGEIDGFIYAYLENLTKKQ